MTRRDARPKKSNGVLPACRAMPQQELKSGVLARQAAPADLAHKIVVATGAYGVRDAWLSSRAQTTLPGPHR